MDMAELKLQRNAVWKKDERKGI